MLELNPHALRPWLPSLDLHEEDGELVLHADLPEIFDGWAVVALDGSDLVVRADGDGEPDAPACLGRLPLPFAPQALRAVALPDHRGLEVRITP